MSQAEKFYLLSPANTQKGDAYITLWRPNCCGYAHPVSWAGKYDKAVINDAPAYYRSGDGSIPVPCEVVERLAIPPMPGMIDGNEGPVLVNAPSVWFELLRHALPTIETEKIRNEWQRRLMGPPKKKGARR